MKKILVAAFLLVSLSCFSQGTVLVANKEDNSLSFIDVAQQKVVGTISVGVGPHEVAVSPSGKTATVANYGNRAGSSHSVSVIDVAKKETIREIDLGDYTRPHGMEFINEDEVIVTSETKGVLLRVNTKTGAFSEVAQTTQLTSHMVTWSPSDQKAYVANMRSGSVSVIDVAQNKLLRNLPFKPVVEGIAVSPDGKELWAANQTDNIIYVINTATFETKTEFPAQLLPYRVRFLPNGKYVVISNGSSGNISIYDAQTKKPVALIDVIVEPGKQPVPGGITASTDNKWVFVCTTGQNQVVMINTKDWTIAVKIDTGKGPDGIYYSKVNTTK